MKHSHSIREVNRKIDDHVLPPDVKRLHLKSVTTVPLLTGTREHCTKLFAQDGLTKDVWIFSSSTEPLRIPRDEASSFLRELQISPSHFPFPTPAKSRTEMQNLAERVKHILKNKKNDATPPDQDEEILKILRSS